MHPRRARLEATRLYLIVTLDNRSPDPAADDAAANEADWQGPVVAALSSGCVGMVQLRALGGDEGATRRWVEDLRRMCADHDALLLLNDRPELAAAWDLDGAHVGQDDLAPAAARALLGPERLLGLSTHDEAEVEAARRAPVDYVGLGPCFPTQSKRLTLRPQGPDLVRRCGPVAGALPLFPIGGIDAAAAPALAAAGARRLAVGAGILGAADPAAAARRLDLLLREAAGSDRA